MKKILFLALLAGITLPATAQKNKKPAKNDKPQVSQPVVDAEEGERMKLMMENRTVTPYHHRIMQMSGPWREEMTFWSKPGAAPTVMNTMREGRPLMEGRYVQFEIMGETAGGHYEARSVIGWDNLKKVYVKTWFDNMSTGIMTMEGVLNEEKNIIEFRGMVMDPASHQPVPVRQVLNMSNPQIHILEVYTDYKGKEFKAMEIKSSRS